MNELIELQEEVDLDIYEQVFMNQMSYTQKQNPKFRATHMSKTMGEDRWSVVKYYRKK